MYPKCGEYLFLRFVVGDELVRLAKSEIAAIPSLDEILAGTKNAQ